jgi:hypothetical protein
MTDPESNNPKISWGELLFAAAFALIVGWGQRKMSSITFSDGLRRLSDSLRPPKDPEPVVPREWLRELYDETR